MRDELIREFRKLSSINEEAFEVGDKILYKGSYMSIAFPGIVTKVNDDGTYNVDFTLKTGRVEKAKADLSDLKLVQKLVKPTPKVKDPGETSLMGRVVSILPGKEPRDWDPYIGEFGVIEGEYMNSYRIAVFVENEPVIYVPKEFVKLEKENAKV